MIRITTSMVAALLAFNTAGAAAGEARATEAVRAEAREILHASVAMQTSEGRGQVPVLAEYLAGKFKAAGFAAEDIEIRPHGETASLVVRYRGSDRQAKPILLLAHMDVVGVEAAAWSVDPFAGQVRDGYVYGRGAIDEEGYEAEVA